MEKDKQVMLLEGEQALVRVNVQMGLVNKVLEEDEGLFSKSRKVILKCKYNQSSFWADEKETSFEFNVNVTKLDLSSKDITSIASEIGQLRNLTHLNLSYNRLENLPAEICQLSNLRHLDLLANRIEKLPNEILHLEKLTSLYLSYTRITDLALEFQKLAQLPNLTHLILNDENSKTLPPEIGQLTKLTKLDLLFEHLTTLPVEIQYLKNLKSLFFDLRESSFSSSDIAKIEKMLPNCEVTFRFRSPW
jgi:hypothetical protein